MYLDYRVVRLGVKGTRGRDEGGSIYIDQAKTKSKKKEKRRNEKPRFLFPFLSAAPVREVSQEPFFLGGERKDRFCRLVPIQIHTHVLCKDSGRVCFVFLVSGQ